MMEVVMMHEGLQSCGGTYRKKKIGKTSPREWKFWRILAPAATY